MTATPSLRCADSTEKKGAGYQIGSARRKISEAAERLQSWPKHHSASAWGIFGHSRSVKGPPLVFMWLALAGCSPARDVDRAGRDAQEGDGGADASDEREAGSCLGSAASAWAEWPMPDPAATRYDAGNE